MRSDALLAFVPLATPLSLVGSAGVGIASGVVDLMGVGSGVAPPNIIGTATLFGSDMGIGSLPPLLDVVLGTGLVTGNSATLNVQFQLAPDTATTYVPGTWQTVGETGPITAAQGTAFTRVARFPWLPAFPETLRPRYARLLFQPASGTNFSAGTVAYALVTIARDDYAGEANAAKNYVVV